MLPRSSRIQFPEPAACAVRGVQAARAVRHHRFAVERLFDVSQFGARVIAGFPCCSSRMAHLPQMGLRGLACRMLDADMSKMRVEGAEVDLLVPRFPVTPDVRIPLASASAPPVIFTGT